MSRNSRIKFVFFRERRRLFFSGIAVVIALAAVLVLMIYNGKNDTYVAMVNNEPISSREFKHAVTKVRMEIYEYFHQKYGVEDSEDFWTTSHGGEVPVEVARKAALNDCVRTKVQEILAKEKGLLEDCSYASFLKDLEKENKRRKKAVERNEPIYGPVQYGENEYYEYVFSNMLIKLKEKLSERELFIHDDDLKSYYEDVKGKLYGKEDYIRIQKIVLPLIDAEGYVNEELKEKQEKKIVEAKTRLEQGETFEEVSKRYNEDKLVQEQIFDDTTVKKDYMINAGLKEEAAKLSAGQVSGIIEANNTLLIIKCIEKKSNDFKTFDKVKDNVRLKCVDARYEEMVDKLVGEAKVEIDEGVYGKILIR